MSKSEERPLTRLELEIMQAVWRLGPSTVAQVQEGLETPRAYTTVQTMLNILEKKGQLRRKLLGRSYEYSAVVSEARASRHALRDFIDRVFGGSADELVMSLVKTRQLDAKRLAALSRKLTAEEEQ
ncbi:MAG TPA: BlaI/MecI/CopY family transcriptional regulator [Acidobacteriaceae bacterium]|nr:BlaI/MecI/CopY family transcriptional regulator [Acidobacteriaceae bacterium]